VPAPFEAWGVVKGMLVGERNSPLSAPELSRGLGISTRRRLRYPVRTSGPVGPVTVRFMAPAKPGWSLEEARELLRQGYTVEHVPRVTGWAPALIAPGPDPGPLQSQLYAADQRRCSAAAGVCAVSRLSGSLPARRARASCPGQRDLTVNLSTPRRRCGTGSQPLYANIRAGQPPV
jgi:hypothetical protein